MGEELGQGGATASKNRGDEGELGLSWRNNYEIKATAKTTIGEHLI